MNSAYAPVLFDFGLSRAQEDRARQLHKESIIIDAMYFGPGGPEHFTPEMDKMLRDRYDLYGFESAFRLAENLHARLASEGKFPAFRELWDISGITSGNRECGNGPFDMVIRTIARITRQFDSFDWLIKATKANHFEQAKREGKHAAFMNAQDVVAIGTDLEKLDLFYDLGMRMLQLTYNTMNYVAVGCIERTDAGLSNFGVKLVKRMNELGMIIDISHTGHQSMMDTCEISEAPVVASHTAVKAISGHIRTKTDEELDAIANTGGVVCMTFCPPFLNTGKEFSICDILNHIDYMVRRIGPEHVGIGTDYPNCAPAWLKEKMHPWHLNLGFREEDRMHLELSKIAGFRDGRDYINITRGLVARGYSDKDIKAILGENFLQVFHHVCG